MSFSNLLISKRFSSRNQKQPKDKNTDFIVQRQLDEETRRDGDDDDYEVSRRIRFTKDCAACPAFPHQVHSPGQRARAGECPMVHASVLGAEAARANTQKREKKVSREK